MAGSGSGVRDEERVASKRLGELLAREGYGLVVGTWRGVDEIVTEALLDQLSPQAAAKRVVHIENTSPLQGHGTRRGRVISSTPSEDFSPAAIKLADAVVVVGGRKGSKPSMDALIARGKPVLPFAWLGSDALASLTDLLNAASKRPGTRMNKRFLLTLVDPSCAEDETVSRVLGGLTARQHDIFVSYTARTRVRKQRG